MEGARVEIIARDKGRENSLLSPTDVQQDMLRYE